MCYTLHVMDIFYRSTRDNSIRVSASEAILKGLSDEGGLFVPESIPGLDIPLEELSGMDYRETAFRILKKFLTDFTDDELRNCINSAYDEKFDCPAVAPLKKAGNAYYLELFHGKTIAFKDMALSILPHLMITSARKKGIENEIVILTATSGDTGKAALAGFADVPGTRIIVFFPKDGVSPVQKRQMVTEKGKNTLVIGVNGNFDDCQSAVKQMFSDKELKERLNARGYQFSSANSINIGRLVPQIVYYVYAYGSLLREGALKAGDKMNVVVPTGNFGNILAAYYARQMGLPISTLICASNENKVLFDFFNTGKYDRNREFILTSSPSMDILISSNLERLIYHITGDDADRNAQFMEDLKNSGRYEISPEMRDKLSAFRAYYASEKDTADKIKDLYGESGYIIDTHTAVAGSAYDSYVKDTGDKTVTVIASTASPYKFAKSVMTAIDPSYASKEDFPLIDELSKLSGIPVPKAVSEIRDAEIIHKTECEKDQMMEQVEKFLS